MKKYFGILKINSAMFLEYRSNLIGLVILQLMGAGMALVLWLAAFQNNSQIAGYNFKQVALYYLLVPLVGVITQVNISGRLGYEIKDGVLSNSLLKPFNFWLGSFMRVVAEKINQLAILVPFYFIIAFLLFHFWGGLAITWHNILLAGIMAIFAFLTHFLLDLNISWLSFWVGDVWCFQHFKTIAFGILGGVSFPFEFLPLNLRAIFEILPFKFFYYTPLGYLLGKRAIADLPMDILQVALWGLFFFCLSFILWNRGLKIYEAYGN